MIPKIFDVQNNKVILNDVVLRIPLLKDFVSKREDALDVFNIIWFYFDLQSPYVNVEEDLKLDIILEDLKLTDKLYKTDPEFCKIFDWVKDKYQTTGEKFWLNHKRNIENIGVWASTPVVGGKDGDAAQKISAAKEAKRLYLELISFEQEVMKGLKVKGDQELSYDQQ